MFGIFRLVLALMIAASHILVRGPWNYGAAALTGFFLLSGFAVGKSFQNKPINLKSYTIFIKNRAIKIYPLYWLLLILTYFIYATLLEFSFVNQLFPHLSNFVGIYLEFYPNIPVDVIDIPFRDQVQPSRMPLIPVAWSLSLFLQAYLILPIIEKWPHLRQYFYYCALAFFASIKLQHDFWVSVGYKDLGYGVLPGVLFIFIFGLAITQEKLPILIKRYLIPTWAVFVILGYNMAIKVTSIDSYGREVITGFVLCSLLLIRLRNVRYTQLDKLLGNISLVLFLSHYLVRNIVFDLLESSDLAMSQQRVIALITSLIIAVVFGYIYTVVDRKFTRRYIVKQ